MSPANSVTVNESPLQTKIPSGMRTFTIIWLGQLVSTIGSGLTSFALGIWILQTTGSATQFAITFLCTSLPNILVSPLAGALVDRWDRRRVMLLSDIGAGLSTAAVALLIFTGNIQVWHIYVSAAVNAFFTAFQWPAYTAATTMLVPKKQFGRASGMSQTSHAIVEIVAPALAGVLLVTIGIRGVIAVDFITCILAVTTLLFVRIPRLPQTKEGAASRGTLRDEIGYGWRYLKERPGLIGLLTMFAVTNFSMSTVVVLFTPYLMGITTPDIVGTVFSISGVGMLLGALAMSTWGGPKRRVPAIILLMSFQGLLVMTAGFQPNLILITGATFLYMMAMPLVNGCSQALWLQKVAPDVQGRVFAVRRMIAWSMTPLAYALAGPLADRLFEPWMAANGALAATVGRIIGVGPGRGVALMYILVGLLTLTATTVMWTRPRLRHLENELPDAVAE